MNTSLVFVAVLLFIAAIAVVGYQWILTWIAARKIKIAINHVKEDMDHELQRYLDAYEQVQGSHSGTPVLSEIRKLVYDNDFESGVEHGNS